MANKDTATTKKSPPKVVKPKVLKVNSVGELIGKDNNPKDVVVTIAALTGVRTTPM